MGVGYRPPYTPLGAVLFVAPHLGLLCALSLPPTSFLRPAVFAPAIIFGLWYTNLSYTIGKPVEVSRRRVAGCRTAEEIASYDRC